MKSMGIIRKIDNLGRVVLPAELRRQFDIEEKDAIEIYTEEDKIILKKYTPTCIFCDNQSDLVSFDKKVICRTCIDKLNSLL